MLVSDVRLEGVNGLPEQVRRPLVVAKGVACLTKAAARNDPHGEVSEGGCDCQIALGGLGGALVLARPPELARILRTHADHPVDLRRRGHLADFLQVGERLVPELAPERVMDKAAVMLGEDRKSTRLNSSHVAIS